MTVISPGLTRGKSFPLAYRILPVRGDHESCVFEVMAMLQMPDGVPLPKDVPLTMTPTDEPWAALQGYFGKGVAVFDQDQANLIKFQSGLRQNGLKQVHLSNYQERNVRNFLMSIEKRIEAGRGEHSSGAMAATCISFQGWAPLFSESGVSDLGHQ